MSAPEMPNMPHDESVDQDEKRIDTLMDAAGFSYDEAFAAVKGNYPPRYVALASDQELESTSGRPLHLNGSNDGHRQHRHSSRSFESDRGREVVPPFEPLTDDQLLTNKVSAGNAWAQLERLFAEHGAALRGISVTAELRRQRSVRDKRGS
jgi:hypothetical protein